MKNLKNAPNNILSDNSHFILYDISNYKGVINNSVSEILNKFVSVMIEYMRFISEKITMKTKTYYCFIFERGIETLIHVFSIIFYYTKNLELTVYHTQKAYYFYIEFIVQMSDDNVSFLQLSSRDAILFVYKKTIFDVNNEYKKNVQEPTQGEKLILETVNSYIYIYKSIVLFIINHNGFKYEHKINYINICCNSIEFISEIINKNKIKQNCIECIYLFCSLLDDKKIDILDFFRLLEQFIKKVISIKKIDETIIKNKIYNSEINNFVNDNELNNIVEWIFTD
jgi:hypothetical protein